MNSTDNQALILSNNKLKEYLAALVDLEQHRYFSDRLLEKLAAERADLNRILSATAPQAPAKPAVQQTAKGGTMGVVLAILGCVIVSSTSGSGGGFIGIPLLIWGVVKLIDYYKCSTNDKKINTSNANRYASSVAQYKKNLSAYNARKKEAAARLSIVKKMQSAASGKRAEIDRCLDRYYGLNVIYPSYRGMTNVCMLYEYISSGRAHSLQQSQSDQGAYNILGQEILMHKILMKLDEIIDHLQQIKNNQNTIYRSIEKTNDQISNIEKDIDKMSDKLKKIDANASNMNRQADELIKKSSLAAYYQEQNTKQLEYMNRMNYYSGNYGATSALNMPPRS